MQCTRRSGRSTLVAVLQQEAAIPIMLGLGRQLRSEQRGTQVAEQLVVNVLTTIFSIVQGQEDLQVRRWFGFLFWHRGFVSLFHDSFGHRCDCGHHIAWMPNTACLCITQAHKPPHPVLL